MSNVSERLYSYDEYLALEAASLEKHEYFQGRIRPLHRGPPTALAGSGPAHAALVAQVTLAMGGPLRGTNGRPYSAGLCLQIEDTDFTCYPDLTVICGPLRPAARDANAVTNPTVLVEVLAPDTEAVDRGETFDQYRRLPILQDYILVASDTARVEVYHRLDDGSWRLTIAGPGASVLVESLGTALAVDAIYEGIELAPPSRREREAGGGVGQDR